MMSTSASPLDSLAAGRNDSPDPASHATNIYDDEGWLDEDEDEDDDDDMDFEDSNARGESEELEYFEATEDDGDAEFEGETFKRSRHQPMLQEMSIC